MRNSGSTIERTEAGEATRPAKGAPTSVKPRPNRGPRFAALESRNFRLLWFGLLISNAGTWMDSTAEGWLVTELKPDHAAFWLGLISATFAIPMLTLPLFGGALADRIPRMRVLWSVQILYMLFSTVLATLTLTGRIQVWMLIVYAFFNSVVLAFDGPVRHAFLPDILSRDQLPSGVSLNSVAFTGASLVGPALAGILIPIIGVGGVFAVNAASCIAILVALARMRDLPPQTIHHSESENVWQSIGRGVKFVMSSPMLSGLLLISTAASLFLRSFSPLLAVFARDVFHVGSGRFGLLVSVGGLGTLIGAFGLAGRAEVHNKGVVIRRALLAQSVVVAIFAASGLYYLSLPLLALAGCLNAIAGALIATLLQLHAPRELRGRVMSMYLVTVVGVPSVGSFLLGAFASLTNVQFAVATGAILVMLAIIGIFTLRPELRAAN